MSGDVVALALGTILAVGALAFVLYPLFFAVSNHARRDAGGTSEDSAVLALREIEFDRATGKLSEADYRELKQTYATRAVREMRATQPAAAPASVPAARDDIEARVREYRMTHRECATCGVRPEPDAAYCSTCGGYLDNACRTCGAAIVESGALFCSSCGTPLTQSATPALV